MIIWVKGMFKRQKEFESALKALAHDSFYRQCRTLLPQDSITEDELENLNYLHDAYTSLGLNGTGEELYKRCLEKPIEQRVACGSEILQACFVFLREQIQYLLLFSRLW